MQEEQNIWRWFRRVSRVGTRVRWICILLIVLVALLCSALEYGLPGAHAQSQCSGQVSSTSSRSNQTTCTSSHNASNAQAVKGNRNPFPYGSCTWWAAQRYHELSGIYVPWTTQANAWEWTARAQQFGWKVSGRPSPGAIMNLQPWVEGAYDYGHVAIVEKVLPGGRVLASSMNWGYYPWSVTQTEFTPGQGVSFITF